MKLDRARPTKVVATEWNVVESLALARGSTRCRCVVTSRVQETWDSAVPLKNEPKDIGTRGEPSVDTVALLAPTSSSPPRTSPQPPVKQLREVAPVIEG